MDKRPAEDFNPEDPEPGIYEDVPMEHYVPANALGSGQMSTMLGGPANFLHEQEKENTESEAAKEGTAIHALSIEGVLAYKAQYGVFDGDRRTKAGKVAYKEVLDSGLIPLKPEQAEMIGQCAATIETHPEVQRIQAMATGRELTVVWMEPVEVGPSDIRPLKCKCRFDWVGETWGADLKTLAPPRFGSKTFRDAIPGLIEERRWYVTVPYYMRGFLSAFGKPCSDFYLVLARRGAGYEHEVVRLSHRDLTLGNETVSSLLRDIVLCDAAGEYPATTGLVQDVELGKWARERAEGRIRD